jgi:peptide/nickel transport system substrate-binding protein
MEYTFMTRRELLRLFGMTTAGVALMPVIEACGGGQPAATGPRRGGTLVIAASEDPRGLVANFVPQLTPAGISANMFSQLLRYDLQSNLISDLADSWSISPDGLTWTFKLNHNATWHDGQPVTADDIVWNITDQVLPGPFGGPLQPTFDSATAADTHTFVLKTKVPTLIWTDNPFANWPMLPKHIYAGAGDPSKNPANDHPIGSGPFKFSKWNKGSTVEMVRNDKYFRPNRPYLDRVVFQTTVDPNTYITGFEAGEIDFLNMYEVPYDRLARYRTDSRFTVIDGGGSVGAVYLMEFNLRNKYLKNTQVRQAIARAIDRNDLNQKALFGQGKVAQSILGPSLTKFYDPQFDTYSFDVAKANSDLDAAGFPKGADGTRFSLRLDFYSGYAFSQLTADLIQSSLAKVGITVSENRTERGAFEAKQGSGDFDLAMRLWATGPQPDIQTGSLFLNPLPSGAPNWMAYPIGTQLNDLLTQAGSTADEAKHKGLWSQIQGVLMGDLPVLSLYQIPNVQLTSSKYRDVVTSGPWGYMIQGREDAYTVG